MHLPVMTPTAQRIFAEGVERHALSNMEQIKVLHECFGRAIAAEEDLVYTIYVDQAITELVRARPVPHDERVKRIVSALTSHFHVEIDNMDGSNDGFYDAEGDLQTITNNLWSDDGTITVQIGGIPLVITISEAPSI